MMEHNNTIAVAINNIMKNHVVFQQCTNTCKFSATETKQIYTNVVKVVIGEIVEVDSIDVGSNDKIGPSVVTLSDDFGLLLENANTKSKIDDVITSSIKQVLSDRVYSSTNDEHQQSIVKPLVNNYINLVDSHMFHPDYARVVYLVANKLQELQHIMSIQPIQGPTGLVYMIRIVHNQTEPDASDDFFVPNTNQIKMDIVSWAVSANTAKFMPRVSTKDPNDTNFVVLAKEIAETQLNNITSMLVRDIIVDYDHVYDAIINSIIQIKRTSGRGKGNIIVTTQEGAITIRSTFRDTNMVSLSTHDCEDLSKDVLLLADTYTDTNSGHVVSVYVCDWRHDEPSTIPVLVGYKGKSLTDTGYVYAPYQLLLSVGPVTSQIESTDFDDMQTGESQMTFITRGGNTTNEQADTSNYYRFFKITKQR